MRMSKSEYIFHRDRNDLIWQCHVHKCIIRDFKKGVKDGFNFIINLIEKASGKVK